MAAKNEAKIKFSADTKELNSAIKSAKNEIKDANAQIKLAAAEFRNTGDAAEFYAKKSEALEKKLEANKSQQEALTEKIEIAGEIYGESSDEVSELERQLTALQTAEQNIIADISDCNDAIEAQADESDKTNSAMGELQATIEQQTNDLDDLKEAYANAYLEYGPMSDECQELEGQIADLSADLDNNRDRLEEATGAANDLAGGYDNAEGSADTLEGKIHDVGDESSNMSGIFGGSIGDMAKVFEASSIMDLITGVITVIGNVASATDQMRQDWEDACDAMANSTGDVGWELDRLESSMQNAYKETRNVEMSQEDMAAVCGQIRTLFGYEGDELGDLAVRMSEFSYVTGADGVEGVTKLYQIMQKWGDQAGTNKEVVDKLTHAAQTSGDSIGTIMNIMSNCHGAMDALGMSFDEGVGFIEAYCQAGGNASDVSRILTTAQKNLADSGLDAGEAWDLAVQAMSDSTNTIDGLNAKIGETDMTISDVFGDGKAGQAIVDVFSNGKVAIEDYTAAVADSNGQLEKTMLSNYSVADNAKKNWANMASEVGSAIQEVIEETGSWAKRLEGMGEQFGRLSEKGVEMATSSTAYTEDVAEAFETMAEVTRQPLEAVMYQMASDEKAVKSMAEATGLSVDQINAVIGIYKGELESAGMETSETTGIIGQGFQTLETTAGGAVEHITGDTEQLANSILNTMAQTGQASTDMQNAFVQLSYSTGTSVADIVTALANGSISAEEFASKTGVTAEEVGKFTSQYATAFQNAAGEMDTSNGKIGDSNKGASKAAEDMATSGTKSYQQLGQTSQKTAAQIEADTKNMAATGKSNFDSFKSTVSRDMNAAQNDVQRTMSAIQNSVNFRWSLPHLAMPHFSVSGQFSANPPSVPSYNVSWYKEGGLIMDSAQIFGLNAATGKFMGGGEAGPEAILPIDLLMDYISEAIQSSTQAIDYDLMADKIADANRHLNMTLNLNSREIGRALR